MFFVYCQFYYVGSHSALANLNRSFQLEIQKSIVGSRRSIKPKSYVQKLLLKTSLIAPTIVTHMQILMEHGYTHMHISRPTLTQTSLTSTVEYCVCCHSANVAVTKSLHCNHS